MKMTKSELPTTNGLYWARQIECDPRSKDFLNFEPRVNPEPVAVFLNGTKPKNLRVFVLGDSESHPIEYFEWFGSIQKDGKTVQSNYY